jgi:hypothetical protein
MWGKVSELNGRKREKKLEKEVRYYFPHNFVLGFEWNE